jgi:hypothetical protein
MLPLCRFAALAKRGNPTMLPDEGRFVMHAPTHRLWRRFSCLLVFLAAGCGLSDYTAQIASEKARVDYWEKETKLLGSKRITMPVFPEKTDKDNKDNKAPDWNLFLRLPQGVSESPTTIAQDKKEAQLFNSVLVQYPSHSKSFGIQNVYLAVGNNLKDFDKKVYEYFGTSPGDEKVETTPRSPTLIPGTGKTVSMEIAFKHKSFPPPGQSQSSDYSFHFFERDKTQVAIVFQLEKGKGQDQKTNEAIKYSLATLGVGNIENSILNSAFNKRNLPPRKK